MISVLDYLYKTPATGKMWHKVNYKEFSFSRELSLSYNLPIAEGKTDGFLPFSRVLLRKETQTVSSKIWSRVDNSISYDDHLYA